MTERLKSYAWLYIDGRRIAIPFVPFVQPSSVPKREAIRKTGTTKLQRTRCGGGYLFTLATTGHFTPCPSVGRQPSNEILQKLRSLPNDPKTEGR